MKVLMITAFLFSLNAFAETISFDCRFTDETYVGQFAISGSIEHEKGEFKNQQFDFLLRTSGRNSPLSELSIVRDGNVQVFPAGSFYTYETMRIVSAVKDAELEYINLLIDVPPLHSSQIRFLNGMTFFGSCKARTL